LQTLEIEPPVALPPPRRPRIISFLRKLGPGLITGASDDDPSGIATYSQAGAQFGYGLLWTQLFSLPLMAAIQEISARIGRVTGRGIAGNIRRTYSKWILYPIILLLVMANTINLGADIGAVGDAVHLLVGGPALVYAALFALLSLGMECFLCYRNYAEYLKWLTIVLFAYVAAAFVAHVPWREATHATFLPHLSFSRDYIATFIAVLGTTISPYLFFWQASMETEEIRASPTAQPLKKELKKKTGKVRRVLSRIRWDTCVGMTFANLVSYCIIVTAAAALHSHGVTDIQTSQQAAKALEPIAGKAALVIFALGIIGTGMLAVPVLAGSAAYAVGEALQWPTGLDRKPLDAKGFYGVVSIATVIGLAINFTHRIDPIKALFWSAVINGVVAVPVMVILMLMIRSRKVMGEFSRVSKGLRVMGWLATLVMAAAAVGLFVTWKQ
jgi:NRAMP (natural resistance-associated macrophage protein)-like metal ion transporter